MPYTAPPQPAPDFTSAKLAGAYPTPPPSPLHDLLSPPEIDVFAQSLKAPRRTPSLPSLRPPSQASTHRALRRVPSVPVFIGRHSSRLSLSSPKGILAVLGGVRVLRVEATSVLDRMPYSPSPPFSTYSARAMGLVESADTDRIETPTSAEAQRIESGAPELRRAQSENDVATISVAPPPAPASGSASKTPTQRSASIPAPIFVHPPTPSHGEEPPETPPPLPRTPQALPDAATPPSTSPFTSPHGSSSSVPTTSSLGITINNNVLPEVRSPRRIPADPLPASRRSRRPRLFGFTGIDHPTADSHSLVTSPEGTSTMGTIPRRSVPQRTKSDTSLYTLGHASPASKEKKEPKEPIIHSRPRRDTGLKLDLKGIVPEPVHSTPVSASVISSHHTIVKKKSGEVVRPALKYSGPLLPNGTPQDKSRELWESRSCPTTPSCPKYVHFDNQLERVKLFLRDQKPEVVSRQGSPELSDAESEDDREVETVLQIKLPNFPTTHPLNADMYLESLFLNDSRDALRGVVVVRNYSFQKWVAVRFTFDWWQTTSEVSASYQDSIRGGTFDRFTFVVKLSDLLERIEEKTLFLCVRYNTDGRELWDSNNGQNYQILFERQAKVVVSKYVPKRTKYVPKGMGSSVRSVWSVTGTDADRMADLRARLNRLTAEDKELNTPIPRSPKARFSSPSRSSPMSPRKSRPSSGSGSSTDTVDLPDLGNRYDFGSSLKASRNLSPTMRNRELQPERHAGTEFYSPRPAFLQGAGPSSPLGALGAPRSPLSSNDSPSSPMSPLPYTGGSSPLAGPPTLGALPALGSGHSSSTTSLSSVNSVMATPADSPAYARSNHAVIEPPQESPSPSPSPSPLSTDSPMSPRDVLPWMKSGDDDMSRTSYSTFIEQFCWGGAAGAPAPVVTSSSNDSSVRRIHSTSALDHYFSSPPDLTPRAFTPTHGLSLSRSTSANDGSASNSSTPLRTKASPPTLEDLEHVDSAIRSLSSSLQSTPVEGSPVLGPVPMTRIPSGNTVLAL